MYRKIMEYLEEWKESPHRKPLILQGARQVGKTYSVLEFGRNHYENVAYFNSPWFGFIFFKFIHCHWNTNIYCLIWF